MIRSAFRWFWRLAYLNPEYLRYSGNWDCRIVNGKPVRLRNRDLGDWVNRFRDQWFLYLHPDLDL